MLRGSWTYLSLGSNLGDRGGHLRRAIGALAGWSELCELECSSVYETAFVGPDTGAEQPHYWNLCLRARIGLGAKDILRRTQALERMAGRPEGTHGQARELDIDLLAHGSLRSCSRSCTLPHPRLEARRFVLEPLAELDTALLLPSGLSLGEALARPMVAAQSVRRLGDAEEAIRAVAEAEE